MPTEMNEEQMGLLAKMKAMVEQKEALEREERQRAEALRAEMAKLEQLKALQQQQQAMLREQQAEADAQAQAMGQPPDAAQYDEYDDDDDDDEVNPYEALQVLEGLKAQLAQLKADPGEQTAEDKAREMALEQELVELRTILQAQVEQMEAQQAANGAAEAAPAPAPPAAASQEAEEDLLPAELSQMLASLHAQKDALEQELEQQLALEAQQTEKPSPAAEAVLEAELTRGPSPTETEMLRLQAQLAAIRAQDSEAAADSSSSDEQRLRTLAQEEAELQQAMAMMQTLKARQEQQERELAMNLPEDESGALSEMLAQQQVAAQPSTDLRTDGYFPAPTEDPEAEDSEDDFDIEELRSKAETPEQLQLLAMMEELLQQKNALESAAAEAMGQEVAAAAQTIGAAAAAGAVAEDDEEARMLQELLQERAELEAELAAKTQEHEEAEAMEQQVQTLLQQKMEEEQGLYELLQERVAESEAAGAADTEETEAQRDALRMLSGASSHHSAHWHAGTPRAQLSDHVLWSQSFSRRRICWVRNWTRGWRSRSVSPPCCRSGWTSSTSKSGVLRKTKLPSWRSRSRSPTRAQIRSRKWSVARRAPGLPGRTARCAHAAHRFRESWADLARGIVGRGTGGGQGHGWLGGRSIHGGTAAAPGCERDWRTDRAGRARIGRVSRAAHRCAAHAHPWPPRHVLSRLRVHLCCHRRWRRCSPRRKPSGGPRLLAHCCLGLRG